MYQTILVSPMPSIHDKQNGVVNQEFAFSSSKKFSVV